MINQDDFHYMWRGKPTRPLPAAELNLLEPVHIYGKQHGRALLLLHGFSSSPAMYRAMIPALENYDALVCPALPGHAENLAAFTSVNADEWVTAAETACEALIKQYETVDVVGLSLGGLLAYHLANKYPIHHLYLLAPAFKLTFNLKGATMLARLLHACGLKHITNRAGNLYTKTHDELTYRKLPVRTIIELFTLIQQHEFTDIACPIDLFLGRHDDVVDSPYIAKHFESNPNCTTHWLENSAHALPLDGDLDEMITCLNTQ
jgi:carboxylesterase|tara:strand:+ start:143463 stop:144248 length:786 start_codon:yes stop_codon:yes gene_type:complete